MALWPVEYESLRAEARDAAEAMLAQFSFSVGDGVPSDPAARLAMQRAALKAWEVVSPEGVDEVIGGVPCRVFRPSGTSVGTYLHFHGGAMTIGSALNQDVEHAELCARLGATVVSVDYRLAPEHPFPAAPDDCFAVAKDLLTTQSDSLVIGGESAGAYLAALTLVRVRDELGAIDRVAGANLIFGIYDLSGTPSQLGVRPGDAPDIVSGDTVESMLQAYTPGRSRLEVRHPSISPMYAPLHDMPPALFTVGSADHLLDDSLFMSRRWEAWGNDAELAVYPDCPHAFLGRGSELANRAAQRIDDFLKRCFN